MRPLLLMLPPLLAAAAPAVPGPVHQLAGRYYKQFQDGLVSGEKYTGEDIVEVVPVTSTAAYLRIHLDYYNGHQCGISGIATATADSLVYRAPREPSEDRPCVLTVHRNGKVLAIDDQGGSCSGYCGARGTLSDVTLPFASKRQIKYLTRLKASEQYRRAMDEWRKEHP